MTLLKYARPSDLPALAIALLVGLMSAAATAATGLPNFADLVEKNAPAIVHISISRRLETRTPIADRELQELLRRLNPGDDSDLNIERFPEQRRRELVGSGFVISADGYIITNNHVVAGADQIQVNLNDRRVFAARVIGLDEPSDLALIKIDADDLSYVEFGDSDALRVGDWVLAIGSPFGLEFSASAGIVSAKGRSVAGGSSYNYMSFIQTDVAINLGNSGGPLFNLDGEVVGINSQILSRTGDSNGVSFSIPSNVAMNVVSQLRESGHVERGLLGVRMGEVDHALAEIYEMDRPRGAFVQEVQPDSPASAAGIENEDIIVEFNGHEVEDFRDLPFYVGQYRPGARANVRLYRNGKLESLTVILGSSPLNTVASVAAVVATERHNPLGFRVGELSMETRRAADLAPGVNGVQLIELDAGPGREAGLRVGDVIVALNRQEISSPEGFAAIADSLPETGYVPIRIVREGVGTTLALKLTP